MADLIWVIPFITAAIAIYLLLANFRGLSFRQYTAPADTDSRLCRKCRYPARANSSKICPECGSDLKVIGTITPKRPSRFTKAGWIVLWLMLWAFPSAWALHYAHTIAPQYGPWEGRIDLYSSGRTQLAFEVSTQDVNGGHRHPQHLTHTPLLYAPPTTAGQSATFHILGPGFKASAIKLRGQYEYLEIDPSNFWYRHNSRASTDATWTKPEVKADTPLTEQALMQWWTEIGFTPPAPALAAKETLDAIHTLSNGQNTIQFTQLYITGSSYLNSTTHTPMWLTLAYLLAWAFSAIAGALLIRSIPQKPLLHPAAEPAPAPDPAG